MNFRSRGRLTLQRQEMSLWGTLNFPGIQIVQIRVKREAPVFPEWQNCTKYAQRPLINLTGCNLGVPPVSCEFLCKAKGSWAFISPGYVLKCPFAFSEHSDKIRSQSKLLWAVSSESPKEMLVFYQFKNTWEVLKVKSTSLQRNSFPLPSQTKVFSHWVWWKTWYQHQAHRKSPRLKVTVFQTCIPICHCQTLLSLTIPLSPISVSRRNLTGQSPVFVTI